MEGSVFVDGVDGASEDELSTQDTDEVINQDQDTEGGDDKSSQETEDSTLKSQEQYTEKGTKLDPNPMSALNQQLANERAKLRQYEEILNNPQLLKKYVSTFDTEGQQEEPDIRPEDIQTTEDLHKFSKNLEGKVATKLKELDSTIRSVQGAQEDRAIATGIQNDVVAVREKYPELNQKSGSYSEDLDKAIGDLYERIDFDPQTKRFRGSIRLSEVADMVMRAAGVSKKQGSQEAQTLIKDRRSGRTIAGGGTQAPDETNLSPSQVIAARMKAAKRR